MEQVLDRPWRGRGATPDPQHKCPHAVGPASMVEVALLVATVVLVVGVVASFVPAVPGGLLSMAGVYGYWWATGWGEPGWVFVAVATAVGLTAVAVDWLAGVVSAKAGGASTTTALVAGVVGLVLVVVATPVGAILGVLATVFAIEVYRGADPDAGARTAVVTAVGLLASNVVQAVLTGSILVGFLLVVL